MANYFSIGGLSKKTRCKIPTIRYYEQQGLLPVPQRTAGNQRRYEHSHLKQLQFICHARELGFTLDDIRELLELSGDEEHCQHVDQVASRHLKEVELKISRLQALRDELQSMLNACEHNKEGSCKVIDALNDHSLCRGEH